MARVKSTKYKSVELHKDGNVRNTVNAEDEVNLLHRGWAPKAEAKKAADAPKP